MKEIFLEIKDICQTQFNVTKIPIHIFNQNGSCLFGCGELDSSHISKIINNSQYESFFKSNNLTTTYLHKKISNYLIVTGPIKFSSENEKVEKKIHEKSFRLIKYIFDFNFNNLNEKVDYYNQSIVIDSKKHPILEIDFKHQSYLLEKKVSESFRNGDLETLLKTIDELTLVNQSFNTYDFQTQKNILVAAVSGFGSIASSEGLLRDIVGYINRQNFKKINQVESEEQLSQVFRSIVVTYMNLIKQLRFKKYSLHVNKSIQFINIHLYDHINSDEVAKFSGVSKKYLSQLFKQETNHSLSDYIIKAKVEEVKKLLSHTTYKLIEIAEMLGYSSQNYLSNQFKKHEHCTPLDYRNRKYT
jgi:AraC-like DNA-binding protein